MHQELQRFTKDVVESIPSRIEEIQLYYASSQWQELGRSIHKLKGLGGNIGFPQITLQCTDYEKTLLFGKSRENEGKLNLLVNLLQSIYDDKGNVFPEDKKRA